jgi:sulfur-oxidizing protein SoxB
MWDVVRDYILAKKDADNVLRLSKINHPTLIGVMHDPGISSYPGKAT